VPGAAVAAWQLAIVGSDSRGVHELDAGERQRLVHHVQRECTHPLASGDVSDPERELDRAGRERDVLEFQTVALALHGRGPARKLQLLPIGSVHADLVEVPAGLAGDPDVERNAHGIDARSGKLVDGASGELYRGHAPRSCADPDRGESNSIW
jgi:hypothetical protein